MKNRNPHNRGLAGHSTIWMGLCSISFCFLTAGHAMAQDTWDGGGGDGLWSNGINWVDDTAPAANANTGALTFAGDLQTSTNNDLTGLTAGAINFTNDNSLGKTGIFTLGGSNAVTLGGTITTTASTGTINDIIDLNLILNGNRTVSAAGSHSLTINGVISESVAGRNLSKAAGGTLTLTNSGNSFTGQVVITNGTVSVNGIANSSLNSAVGAGSSLRIGSGNTTCNLTFTAGATSTNRRVFIGDNSISTSGGARINNNTANGSGALIFTHTDFNPLNTTANTARTLTLGGTNTDPNAINGIIADNNTSGGGLIALTKADAGTWILSGANTYTGNTSIDGGIIVAGNNSAFGSTGTVTLNATDATLALADGITINRGLTVSNTGDKKILALQAGATSAEYSGDITNSEVVAGNFEVSVGSPGTLTLSGAMGGAGTAGLTKTGVGILTLSSASNSYTGATKVSAGTLQYGVASAIPSTNAVTLNSAGTATLDLNNLSGTIASLTLGGTAGTASSTHTVQTGSGTLTLDGNLTTVSTGNPSTAAVISGKLDLGAATRTFTVADSSGSVTDLDVQAAVSGSVGLIKTGSGTLTLSGANDYTGNTSIDGGAIVAGNNSAFGNTGTVSLANTDTTLELFNGITINRALTVSDTGNKKTLALQAGATSAEYSGDITNSEATGGNFEAYVGSSGTLTLSGVVGGVVGGVVNTGALTKTGLGTLVLGGTADNSISLGRPLLLNVTAGEVHLGKASSGSVQAVYGISGIANGATVKLTGTGGNQIYSGNSSNLYGVNGMVAGSTFNLNGNSETLTYLTGTGGIVDGGSGTPTLTIGDKSVNFAFGGVIQNSSGTLSLDKILGGTVTLSGANTYTGATTISSGTLILTGATQATSAISSSTTGKLGLDIGSPVTAANATVTFTNRTVLVTGSPTAASYTLLTASSIVGTPTFAAPAPAGYSLQVVDNNKLLLVKDFLSDPYEAWAGAGVNFDADANNDGVDNGLAWFLGAPDKDANANALLPKASQTAGALVLEFDCLDATARGAAVFQVQYGNDLTAWAGTNVPGTVGTFTAGVVDFDVTDPDAPGGLLKMVATIPVAQAGAGKLFGRINGVK